MPSIIDYAKLAAYIDGEGCISIMRVHRDGTHSLSVSVTNTDPRLPLWCKRTFGGAIAQHKARRSTWKVSYRWTASPKLSEKLLQICYPHFVIKRKQAEIAIMFRMTFTGERRKSVVTEQMEAARRILKGCLHKEKSAAIPLELATSEKAGGTYVQ